MADPTFVTQYREEQIATFEQRYSRLRVACTNQHQSKGNVVAPQKVMSNLGADILRLWVAATDYRAEMSVSDEILKRIADSYRRMRNTIRFLLGNLAGFDPARDFVPVGGFATFQMGAGSLEKTVQFEVVDEHTFVVRFLRKDKLTMNDLAVPVPCIFNSELVKKNATAQDPWGLAWTRNNVAGGGAYKVEAWRSGQEIIYVRNDDWKSGPLPKLRRIVQREVPNAGNRRALLIKGDIDMTYDMPPKDFSELAKDGGSVKVATMPVENAMLVDVSELRPMSEFAAGAVMVIVWSTAL